MKALGNWLVVFAWVTLVLTSCFEPPQFSTIPEIEFESVIFKDVANPNDADSLILTLRFKDGDGDLGLDPQERDCYLVDNDTVCYNDKWYFVGINYKLKRTNPAYAFLPPFEKPYNCINWEVLVDEGKVLDTVYFELNPDHYNIFVDFLVKQPDGSFKEFEFEKEFAYPNCGISFDGRFPILSKDLSVKTALDGKIRYSMQSVGFLILFSIKTLKLRVTIQDRSLHKSNTVESKEFTLQQIKKSG